MNFFNFFRRSPAQKIRKLITTCQSLERQLGTGHPSTQHLLDARVQLQMAAAKHDEQQARG